MVFPAHTGVFPNRNFIFSLYSCLPRTHGGVSMVILSNFFPCRSSPHTRGCFLQNIGIYDIDTVFPAHTGVFPLIISDEMVEVGLPRTHGGVSKLLEKNLRTIESSPHTRGCFLGAEKITIVHIVFPAHTGVFPISSIIIPKINSLPRTHGGVSKKRCQRAIKESSSPHTRGCFLYGTKNRDDSKVFPAHTGVFLYRSCGVDTTKRLPRTHGGVSYIIKEAEV